jgi:concanavalin A-like lectin/glucanase superfamily protein/VCBS repeat protein/type IX secretion system substrate protein
MNSLLINVGGLQMGSRFLKFKIFVLFTFISLLVGSIVIAQDPYPGTALNFDGSNDYVNCGNPGSLSFGGTQAFTIEAWVKPHVNNVDGYIFTKYNRLVNGEYRLGIGGGLPWFHREVAPWNIVGTTFLQQNVWYHIAATYDGLDIRLYINGTLEASQQSGTITATSNNVLIGAQHQSHVPNSFFDGEIDEVCVWNVARTEAEIRQMMRLTLRGSEAGLVSYWQFNEGSGTIAIDSISGNNGTLTNMADTSWVTSTIPINMFTEINAGLTDVGNGSGVWGDYDNDGDLDILLSGNVNSSPRISKIYNNNAGTFTDINAGLTGVSSSSARWGDYDNDGDLDILLTGWTGSGGPMISKIYRNDPSTGSGTDRVFTDINAGLQIVRSGSAVWGDYDNDGDLDILLTGELIYGTNFTRIYRNDLSEGLRVFNDINAGLPDVTSAAAAWGDYDNDGDLDILLTGSTGSGYISKIYRNDSSIFTEINTNLLDIANGSVAWGDYDNDGDLDILLTGEDFSYNIISKIYRNDSGVFNDINSVLNGVKNSSASWGDYDNDGDLDILLTGYPGGDYFSQIYRNDAGIFIDVNPGLINLAAGSAAWGDYDNDNDLDILINGYDVSSTRTTKLYCNNSVIANSVPISPDSLSAVLISDSVNFNWSQASDNETPQNGLSYNIVIGNSEYGLLMNSPMAYINDGYRKIPKTGNVGQNTSWQYMIPDYFAYSQIIAPNYWGVQAIDHNFEGSQFATDNLNIPIIYLQTINNAIMQLTDLLSWEIQFGDSIVNYEIQIDDDSTFASYEVHDTVFVSISGSGYYSILLQDLTGNGNLVAGTKYFWRMKPNYTFGLPTAFTNPAPSFWFEFVSDIEDEQIDEMPKKYALHQNYPNPFNPVTTIKYSLPNACNVKLELFDLKGRKIKILLNESKSAGHYSYTFNGNELASGVFLYRIQAGPFEQVKKLVYIK